MAKLLSYYRLCPLIDTKNLLGIAEDTEKGIVIVTLGRNIAIKYRLSDQKQICSWRSKEKFSSLVQYDKKLEKYVAVFNQTFVRIWSEDEETLDKVKKYKFNHPIHTIINHNGETFVVFKTGSVYPLNEILEDRKTFTPATISEDVEIHDVLHISLEEDLYVGFLSKTLEGFTFYWTIYTYYSKNAFSKENLINEDVLKGYSLFASNKKVHLLTIWDNAKIYKKELVRHDKEQSDLGELFIILENISAEHFVKIVPLDDKYIAIYGSDPNEEGAILLIYNTQFKVTQSKQIHKLYANDAKLWRTYNFILLPVGQNLIVVPFNLDCEQLVALIGSHKPVQTKIDSDIAFVTEYEVANWNNEENVATKKKKNKKLQKQKANSSFTSKLEEYYKEGLPEALILEQIIPEILEESNIKLMEDCLRAFTDIPEAFLAKILQLLLVCNKKKFTKSDTKEYNQIPEELLPNQRIALLDKVLARPFSDILLLPHLKSQLSVDEAVLLLQYLILQLSEEGHNLPSMNASKTEECLIKWTSLVLDSNYQKFVLSKDSIIEGVMIKCKNMVEEHLEVVESLKSIVPVLSKLEAEAKGKSYSSGRLANGFYSIEIIDY
ncbi:unnamed protein product [Ceutorhynchus assimilis]|uniref:Nucleolar protein 11 n=1 Tax=Ceutorhynchus assimilis TaxID=467358 RepID=A0A9N9QLW5_9CUCU|nr:unnamed protein product [Ceutorhynchus assimilis]